MSKDKQQWYPSIVGLGAFVLGTILNLILGPDIYVILGFLTAAIILTSANTIYLFYKKIDEETEINPL